MPVFDTFDRGPIEGGLGTSSSGYSWTTSADAAPLTRIESPGVATIEFVGGTGSYDPRRFEWQLHSPSVDRGTYRILFRITENGGPIGNNSVAYLGIGQQSLWNGTTSRIHSSMTYRYSSFGTLYLDDHDLKGGPVNGNGPDITGQSDLKSTLLWSENYISGPGGTNNMQGRTWPYVGARPASAQIIRTHGQQLAGQTFSIPAVGGGLNLNFYADTYDTPMAVGSVWKFYVYGLWFYNAATDAVLAPYPVEDEFNRSVVYDTITWGTTPTRHLWEGWSAAHRVYGGATTATENSRLTRVFNDYDSSLNYSSNVVVDPSDSYAELMGSEYASGTDNDFLYSPKQFVGQSVSGDVKLESTFTITSGTAVRVHFGIVGVADDIGSNAAFSVRGWWLRVTHGSSNIQFFKKTSTGTTNASFAAVGGTGSIGTSIAVGTKYKVLIERVGSTLRAKVWPAANAEPGSWHLSITETTNLSGRYGIFLLNGTTIRPLVKLHSMRYSQIYGVNATTLNAVPVLGVSNITGSSATLTATYTGDNNNNNSVTFYYKKLEDSEWLPVPTTPTVNRTTKVWTTSLVGLSGNTEYEYSVTFSDPDFINGAADHFGTFTTLFTLTRDFIASISSVTTSSISVEASYLGDADEDNAIYMSYRVHNSGDPWSSEVALSNNRTANTATGTIGSLDTDVIYDVRIRLVDADGIEGEDEYIHTTQTISQSVALSSIGVIPQVNSAVINVFYLYDSNENSSIEIQYRSITQTLWTTVANDIIYVDRTGKYFGVTLGNLRPNTTYEVRAIVTDPNGVVYGTSESITGVVTTLGSSQEDQSKLKHYIWKIYDSEDNYLGTWNDVSVPDYAEHENGGVSDLAVQLHRPITSLNDPQPTVAFQNRVDVWCIDPSSEGFGINLINDSETNLGAFTLGDGWSIDSEGGPDRTEALRFDGSVSDNVLSEAIQVTPHTPYVIGAYVRCQGRANITLRISEYSITDGSFLRTHNVTVKNTGQEWQRLLLDYSPESDVSEIRIEFVPIVTGIGGTCFVDKIVVRPKIRLVYRGAIESYTMTIDQSGQRIDVQILGIISQLSDDYIDFLQYVQVQPQKDQGDAELGIPPKPNRGPADPAQMLRDIIDIAQRQNAHFRMYYDKDSIKNTGQIAEYTFREIMIRSAFDKVRELCPPNWHYFIEPDGKVHLRGPEHVKVHDLRIGIEIMNISIDQNIRDLKNVIQVKGRQDEDESEPDGFGSIRYTAFDQESIDKYGKRVLFIRDSNITTPDTAQLVGDGRLEEYNRSQQRVTAYIPDVKMLLFGREGLRGYDIESLLPGDHVRIFDPVAGPRNVYWDQFSWDEESWNTTTTFAALPTSVPIKTIQYHGDHVQLELNERQPSGVGDFGRLYRWIQVQESSSAQTS